MDKRERGIVKRLFVRNFLSESAKKVRVGTFHSLRKLKVSKKFRNRNWIRIFSFENVLSQSTENCRRRTLLCFNKIRFRNFFYAEERGASRNCRKTFSLRGISLSSNFFMNKKGLPRFSVGNLSPHSTEKNRGGNIQCFRKLRVSEVLLHQKRDLTILR